jgi:REP element-mobilizing transposase RayT
MARPLRLSFENAVYHITARGNRKENIYYGDDDRGAFLERIDETCRKYSIICYAYCLMDNHYHLFVKTPLANVSDGMHYLNASYTNWFKAKHEITGAIFQGRYKSMLVDEDNYAIQLSAYIHANPLRAGIVHHPGDYEWSSYANYMGRRKSFSGLNTEFILNQFDNQLSRARKKYERYVLTNLAGKDLREGSYRGIALGGEEFIEKVKEKIKAIGSKREIAVTRDSSSREAEEIIQQVMDELSISREDIFMKRRGNIYRQMILYLLKKFTSLSLKEIGEMFEMDYAAVSQACKRYEEKIGKGESLREMLNVET